MFKIIQKKILKIKKDFKTKSAATFDKGIKFLTGKDALDKKQIQYFEVYSRILLGMHKDMEQIMADYEKMKREFHKIEQYSKVLTETQNFVQTTQKIKFAFLIVSILTLLNLIILLVNLWMS